MQLKKRARNTYQNVANRVLSKLHDVSNENETYQHAHQYSLSVLSEPFSVVAAGAVYPIV
jgi:hypothetical protein